MAGNACNLGCFRLTSGAAYDISDGYVLGMDETLYEWNASGQDWSPWGPGPQGTTIEHIGGPFSFDGPWIMTTGGGNNIYKLAELR